MTLVHWLLLLYSKRIWWQKEGRTYDSDSEAHVHTLKARGTQANVHLMLSTSISVGVTINHLGSFKEGHILWQLKRRKNALYSWWHWRPKANPTDPWSWPWCHFLVLFFSQVFPKFQTIQIVQANGCLPKCMCLQFDETPPRSPSPLAYGNHRSARNETLIVSEFSGWYWVRLP